MIASVELLPPPSDDIASIVGAGLSDDSGPLQSTTEPSEYVCRTVNVYVLFESALARNWKTASSSVGTRPPVQVTFWITAFSPEPVSAGHRFPMGLALDRDGELFATDNQGNYKPFNELNHVRRGAHFGFVNFLERGKPQPPVTPPAIDIPHPWTRSVNGICFLDSSNTGRLRDPARLFGPFEGHLVGCEYDTCRLIRMTLQRVGDTIQGAAYPLSIPPALTGGPGTFNHEGDWEGISVLMAPGTKPNEWT